MEDKRRKVRKRNERWKCWQCAVAGKAVLPMLMNMIAQLVAGKSVDAHQVNAMMACVAQAAQPTQWKKRCMLRRREKRPQGRNLADSLMLVTKQKDRKKARQQVETISESE